MLINALQPPRSHYLVLGIRQLNFKILLCNISVGINGLFLVPFSDGLPKTPLKLFHICCGKSLCAKQTPTCNKQKLN